MLVVDDDRAVRDVIHALLELAGYSVADAHNGRQALARVAEHRPAVILLDLHMPVMDGWEFCRRLREWGQEIPVVFMTAGGSARDQACRHRADGYLAKPFDIDHLLRTVGRFAPGPV